MQDSSCKTISNTTSNNGNQQINQCDSRHCVGHQAVGLSTSL